MSSLLVMVILCLICGPFIFWQLLLCDVVKNVRVVPVLGDMEALHEGKSEQC